MNKNICFYFPLLLLTASLPLEAKAIKYWQVDLSGKWEIIQRECLPTEQICNTTEIPRIVWQPKNLREKMRHFFGSLTLQHTFQIQQIPALENVTFFAGAMASTDRVYVNGKLIGGFGQKSDKRFLAPLWMVPRQYTFSSNLLKRGENTIKVVLNLWDEPAGIHIRPLLLVDTQQIGRISLGNYIQQLFIPIAIFFNLLIISLLLSVVFIFKLHSRKIGYFLLALFTGGPYVLSMTPIPLPLPYLMQKQLALFSGLFGVIMSVLYFLHTFKPKVTLLDYSIVGIGIAAAVAHFFMPDYYHLYWYSLWIHPMVILYLALGDFIIFRYGKNMVAFEKSYKAIGWLYMLAPFFDAIDYWNRLGYSIGSPFSHLVAIIAVVVVLAIPFREAAYFRDLSAKIKIDRYGDMVRIARDLHDVIGSDVTAFMQMIRNSTLPTTVLSKFENNLQIILDNLREIVYTLQGNAQHTDLALRFRDYIYRFADPEDQRIEMDISSAPDFLSLRESTEVYRIFLEAVSNSMRYSDASKIKVSWRVKPNTVFLAISDNGIGFSEKEIIQSGLNHLRIRAKTAGGHLRISSNPNQGSLIAFFKKKKQRD
ncbi:MAG: hypothetical protein D6767_04375 [Candidatus Hydrogenedentota bacterium]|nr:MAG: hypothetical protein D6767_04375 [Candidatus Hydrogenedentota bacterium]